MFGAACKGLHCAGCKPQFSIPPGVIIVILCLIYRVQIEAIVTAIVLILLIAAAVGVISFAVIAAIVYPIMMKWLMPRHVLFISPGAYVRQRQLAEARNVQAANPGNNQKRRVLLARNQIRSQNGFQVLPRTSYEWAEERQQQIPNRRNSIQAGD